MEGRRPGRKHRVEEILGVLKELESGVAVGELSRKHSVSEWTIYRWRRRYGDMTESEAARLRQLESENSKLRRIVADQALEITGLKDVVSKKW
jgi:putative transposase